MISCKYRVPSPPVAPFRATLGDASVAMKLRRPLLKFRQLRRPRGACVLGDTAAAAWRCSYGDASISQSPQHQRQSDATFVGDRVIPAHRDVIGG